MEMIVVFELDARDHREGLAARIRDVCRRHPGNHRVVLEIQTSADPITMHLGDTFRVDGFDSSFRAELDAILLS